MGFVCSWTCWICYVRKYTIQKNAWTYLGSDIYTFFYKQHFFSTQPQCCLTFSWIKLQMLLQCCLIHVTIVILKHILWTLFFEWAKILKTKFPKNRTFVINSLNFWNNQQNSWKNFFIVSIIDLHTWNSKVRSKNWEKWSFVFLLFENHFLWFKTKITFLALYWYLKN